MKYEKGKAYKFTSEYDPDMDGTFEVIRIGKARKHTGTVFIYFKGLSGGLAKVPQSFMIGSEFDFASKLIKP